jgi:hypothetical protein
MTLQEQARQLIFFDDPIIYDVAQERNQKVEDVRESQWFVRAVAEYLETDPTYYQEVVKEMNEKHVG